MPFINRIKVFKQISKCITLIIPVTKEPFETLEDNFANIAVYNSDDVPNS